MIYIVYTNTYHIHIYIYYIQTINWLSKCSSTAKYSQILHTQYGVAMGFRLCACVTAKPTICQRMLRTMMRMKNQGRIKEQQGSVNHKLQWKGSILHTWSQWYYAHSVHSSPRSSLEVPLSSGPELGWRWLVQTVPDLQRGCWAFIGVKLDRTLQMIPSGVDIIVEYSRSTVVGNVVCWANLCSHNVKPRVLCRAHRVPSLPRSLRSANPLASSSCETTRSEATGSASVGHAWGILGTKSQHRNYASLFCLEIMLSCFFIMFLALLLRYIRGKNAFENAIKSLIRSGLWMESLESEYWILQNCFVLGFQRKWRRRGPTWIPWGTWWDIRAALSPYQELPGKWHRRQAVEDGELGEENETWINMVSPCLTWRDFVSIVFVLVVLLLCFLAVTILIVFSLLSSFRVEL